MICEIATFIGWSHSVCTCSGILFFQQTWATALWPLPDTRLSYTFIAATLAGGAPLIWIGLSGSRVTALMIIVFNDYRLQRGAGCLFLIYKPCHPFKSTFQF